MAKMEKRQRNLLIFLIIVLAGAGIDFAVNTEDYLKYYGGDVKEQAIQENKVAKPKIAESQEMKLRHYNEWNRDPFHDLTVRTTTPAYKPRVQGITLELKAISIAEGKSVAMINSEILAEGGSIEGYTVKSIQPRRVVLEKNGQSKTLMLQ